MSTLCRIKMNTVLLHSRLYCAYYNAYDIGHESHFHTQNKQVQIKAVNEAVFKKHYVK